jgi:hypothetical protein
LIKIDPRVIKVWDLEESLELPISNYVVEEFVVDELHEYLLDIFDVISRATRRGVGIL